MNLCLILINSNFWQRRSWCQDLINNRVENALFHNGFRFEHLNDMLSFWKIHKGASTVIICYSRASCTRISICECLLPTHTSLGFICWIKGEIIGSFFKWIIANAVAIGYLHNLSDPFEQLEPWRFLFPHLDLRQQNPIVTLAFGYALTNLWFFGLITKE